MNHYAVPVQLLFDLWPAVAGYAERAMRWHPFMNGQDLYTVLERGKAQLFVSTDASGVVGFIAVEVVEYPRCKVANVFAAGGKRGFLSVLVGPLRAIIEAWAATQGADTFAVVGRPGWLRFARAERANTLTLSTAWTRLGNVQRRRLNQHNHEVGPMGPGATLSPGCADSGK